jgi:glycosyltransferase involved in cell wall biosynthesis
LLPSKRTPKWEELFGIVIIEAMACGVVPLVTDHVGPRSILADNLPDLLIPEASFINDACGILNHFQEDPSYLSKRRNVAKRVSEFYTIEAIAEKWKVALMRAGCY